MIRHAFLRNPVTPPIRALTVSMIESSLGTVLMTPVGQAPALTIALVATGRTAVTVPAVAVVTDPEQLQAGEADPWK